MLNLSLLTEALKESGSERSKNVMSSESLQRKSLDSPDETRSFKHGKVGIVSLGDFTASRLVFEPGWRWSENVKPLAGTDSCQVLHTGYHVSGRLHVRLDDGTEEEFGPGDAYVIPPGHDARLGGGR
jgi:quercetin dioxygenase-like cupin family protein